MELRGQLRRWDDQKGFGFIRPEQGGDEVFAHISAMRGNRRPVQGDTVLYMRERNKDGRLRATHIRLDEQWSIDEPAIRRKPIAAARRRGQHDDVETPGRLEGSRWPGWPVQRPLWKLAALALLCVLPAIGAIRLAEHGSDWPLLAYPAGSLAAFALYLHDKRSALCGRWRTPEVQLHLIELLGGWPGALVAQQAFRHKTRKPSFQLVFWLIVIAHQVVWLDYLYLQYLSRLLSQI